MCQEAEYLVWSLFCYLWFCFVKLLFLFQVFPALCRNNIPGIIPGRKQNSWSQHSRVCLRVMFYSLHGAFHFGMHWAHSLPTPRNFVSKLSSSPGVANTDVKRAGELFCPHSQCFLDTSVHHLLGRSEICFSTWHLEGACPAGCLFPLILKTKDFVGIAGQKLTVVYRRSGKHF